MSTVPNPTLLALSANDPWTLMDAFEGTVIFGGNGSGKTSGSGKDIAKSFLRNGYGGLVLTVKVDEADRWRQYMSEAGRSADLIEFRPGDVPALNFMDYEASRPGAGAALTYELVRILQTAMEGGRERGKSENPYWDDAVAQLLTNAIDLVLMATGSAMLPDIIDVVRSAPLSPADVATLSADPARRAALRAEQGCVWADDSRCAALLGIAFTKTGGTPKAEDFRETHQFFTREWALLDDRTRSNILSTLMSRLTGLLRSPFRQLFCGPTTITPESTFGGKVILLNLPVKEYGEAGRFAQILFKTIWQRAVERRGSTGQPTFL